MKQHNDNLCAIDLFAGGGGLSLGFMNAGFAVAAAFDAWKPAVDFYRRNIPSHPIFQMDLAEPSSIAKISEFAPNIIIGGPPCQDFSSAGKRDESLGRANLTIVFAGIVKAVSPQWFVMENVDRALKSKACAAAKDILLAAGYHLISIVLDASRHGAPQRRKRLFLIGDKEGKTYELEKALLNDQAEKQMTLRDYFGDSLGLEHYYRHPRSYRRRGVFSIDEPSPTVRGVNRPIPKTYKSHPGDTKNAKGLRPLTTKERSMIQTFPESFVIEGGKSDLESIIGNAVPVKLAEFVAGGIYNIIINGRAALKSF